MLVHTVCVCGGGLWHHHPTTCWMFWPWPQGQLSEGGLTQIMKCHISLFKKNGFLLLGQLTEGEWSLMFSLWFPW